jgi:(p)ppGpp synthase/HD superfamily hydrolase
MIYTAMTKKAMKLAYEAHQGQTDKNGMPYIFHPVHLAEQMTDENTTVCALLHDVVEDTPYTLADLRAMGFPPEVIDALTLLTHDKSVPYMDYVRKIKTNRIASAVKLADLRHNSDLSRLDTVDDDALKRVKKYKQAMSILTGEEA